MKICLGIEGLRKFTIQELILKIFLKESFMNKKRNQCKNSFIKYEKENYYSLPLSIVPVSEINSS